MIYQLQLQDPAVQAAIIGAIGSTVAALLAAVAAAIIGRDIANRARTKEKLQEARSDIAFLLTVESLHCKRHKEVSGQSMQITIRNEARHLGMVWSGQHTPGRVRG